MMDLMYIKQPIYIFYTSDDKVIKIILSLLTKVAKYCICLIEWILVECRIHIKGNYRHLCDKIRGQILLGFNIQQKLQSSQ